MQELVCTECPDCHHDVGDHFPDCVEVPSPDPYPFPYKSRNTQLVKSIALCHDGQSPCSCGVTHAHPFKCSHVGTHDEHNARVAEWDAEMDDDDD